MQVARTAVAVTTVAFGYGEQKLPFCTDSCYVDQRAALFEASGHITKKLFLLNLDGRHPDVFYEVLL